MRDARRIAARPCAQEPGRAARAAIRMLRSTDASRVSRASWLHSFYVPRLAAPYCDQRESTRRRSARDRNSEQRPPSRTTHRLTARLRTSEIRTACQLPKYPMSTETSAARCARNDSITVHAMPRPGASLAKQKEKITRTNLRMLTKTHEQGRVIRRFRTAKRGEEKPAFSRENQRYFVQTVHGCINDALLARGARRVRSSPHKCARFRQSWRFIFAEYA